MQDSSSLYPALLSPYTLRGGRLRNRVMHASMTTRLAEHGRVTDRLIQYHVNRARGSAALIVTEPLSLAALSPCLQRHGWRHRRRGFLRIFRAPEDGLAEPLRAAGVEVHVIGDCKYPRTMLAATAEGHAAGNAL